MKVRITRLPQFDGGGRTRSANTGGPVGGRTRTIATDSNIPAWAVRITDPRKKLLASGNPVRPNRDLVSGDYDSNTVRDIIAAAHYLKIDPYTALAVGLQETKLGYSDTNIGHVKDGSGDMPTTSLNPAAFQFITTLKDKLAQGSKLYKDEASQLQAYNGYGILSPHSDQWYYGHQNKTFYGVDVTKPIDMKKNPLYGKTIVDIRDNVLKKNKGLTDLVDNFDYDNYDFSTTPAGIQEEKRRRQDEFWDKKFAMKEHGSTTLTPNNLIPWPLSPEEGLPKRSFSTQGFNFAYGGEEDNPPLPMSHSLTFNYGDMVRNRIANNLLQTQQAATNQAAIQQQKKQQAIKQIEDKQFSTTVGVPKAISPYQQAINKSIKAKNDEMMGLDQNGQPTPLTKLADNPTFKNFATNIANPTLAIAGAASGVSDAMALSGALEGAGANAAESIITASPEDAFIRRGLSSSPAYKARAVGEVEKGNQWLSNWYSNPTIQDRYNQWVAEGLPPTNVSGTASRSGKINLSSAYRKQLAGTSARGNMSRFLAGEDLVEPTFEALDPESLTLGKYSHGENQSFVDIYNPNFTRGSNDVANTTVHEGIHKLTVGDRGLTPEAQQHFKEAFEVPTDADGFPLDKHDTYLTEPTEIHARIGELRRQFGLKPEDVVDQPTMNSIIQQGKAGATSVDDRWFQLIKNPDKLRWLFNNAPMAVGAVGTAGLVGNQLKNNSMTSNFATGGLTKSKAREILHDGTAHGRPLTAKQRRFMGYMANRAMGGETNRKIRIVAPPNYASGGRQPIEVEGGEVVQQPGQRPQEVSGPSHEQGGVDKNVRPGTKIYSDRLMIDGKTMAERKLAREKQFAKLRRAHEKNPSSMPLKNSIQRQAQTLQQEEQQDMAIMNHAHATMAPPTRTPPMMRLGGNCFKCGGKVYAYGSDIDDEWDRYTGIPKYQGGGEEDGLGDFDPFNPLANAAFNIRFGQAANRGYINRPGGWYDIKNQTFNSYGPRTGWVDENGLYHSGDQPSKATTAINNLGTPPTFTPTGYPTQYPKTPSYKRFTGNSADKVTYDWAYEGLTGQGRAGDANFYRRGSYDRIKDIPEANRDAIQRSAFQGFQDADEAMTNIDNASNFEIKDNPNDNNFYAWDFGNSDKYMDKSTGNWVAKNPSNWTPGVNSYTAPTKNPPEDPMRMTPGDYMGAAGTLMGGLADLIINKQAARATQPVRNRWIGYGHDAINANEEAQRMLAGRIGDINRDLDTSYNTTMASLRGSSPTVNTLRAMQAITGYESDRAKTTSMNKGYSAIADMMNKEGALLNDRDAKVMRGQDVADERLQQNLDNYFSNKAQAWNTFGQNVETLGRDINTAYGNRMNRKLLAQLNQWGLTFDDYNNIVQQKKATT